MGMPDLIAAVSGRSVTITTSFIAFHQWKDAPPEVAFLRNMHRHQFGVSATIAVSHGDRQVEFFTAQSVLRTIVRSGLEGRELQLSCEAMAEHIGQEMAHNGFYVEEVTVDEDGENAGTVQFMTTERRSGQSSRSADMLMVGEKVTELRTTVSEEEWKAFKEWQAREKAALHQFLRDNPVPSPSPAPFAPIQVPPGTPTE